MKRKIVFITILFFCFSILSSAGKNDGQCCEKSFCPEIIKKQSPSEAGFDLSPVQFFVFGI